MSGRYQVRVVGELWGRRMIISRKDGKPVRCGWDRLQRLKDEHLGPEACAVEVFPPTDEVVDEVNYRHLFEVDPGRAPSLYNHKNPAGFGG